jgi:hypothetical protein
MSWRAVKLDDSTLAFGVVLNPDAIVLLSALVESYEGSLGAVHTLDPNRAVLMLTVTNDTLSVAKEFLESLHWAYPLPIEEEDMLRQ